MTQTLRRAPRRAPDVRRRGRIYAFSTLKVHESGDKAGLVLDGSVEDGYVGKTRQTLAQREQQHRGGAADGTLVVGEDLEEQPWWPITVGGIRLLEQGDWTDAELDERERYWIHRIKPRYNVVDNLANERRIPKYTAWAHRAARDKAAGIPSRWTLDGKPNPNFEAEAATLRGEPVVNRPAPTQRARAAASGVWSAYVWPALRAILRHQVSWWAFGALTLWAALHGALEGVPHAGLLSLAGAVGTVAGVAWRTTPKRRARRRR